MVKRILRVIGMIALLSGGVTLAHAERRIPLQGHVSPELARATRLERVPSDEQVPLSLTIQIDQHLLDEALAAMYGPSAPQKKRYLTAAEFAEKFGLREKRKKVKEFAAANGLTLDPAGDKALSMVVKVVAPAARAEKAFGVHLHHYRGADGKIFRSNDTDPTIPESLAAQISGVIGLSTHLAELHPNFQERPLSPGLRPGTAVASLAQPQSISGGHGSGGALAPADIKTIYGLGSTSLTGTGQTMAIFELDGYKPADIAFYETTFGLPAVPLVFKSVDGSTNLCNQQNCATQTTSGDPDMSEVALDIELAIAMAPGLSQILVYDGKTTSQHTLDTYDAIATDNLAQVVSTSWGAPELGIGGATASIENTIFQRMALQGQSIYAASGDRGSNDNGSTLSVEDPASQPYMTGVGGTTLTGSVASPVEASWTGSGGGVSALWSLPSYQTGTTGLSSPLHRNVPDIALDADPFSGFAVYVAGGWHQIGGTSASAPLWAGFTALVNQQCVADGHSVLGFANPTLYSLGKGGSYHSLFMDITSGSNGAYTAGAGYDNVTGWGSFKGPALINALDTGVVASSAPVIGQAPASQTIYVGETATFSVTATGVAPFTYQWRKNGTPISGATSASYTTPQAVIGDNGALYSVVVDNGAHAPATSGAGVLTVNALPAVTLNIPSELPITDTIVIDYPYPISYFEWTFTPQAAAAAATSASAIRTSTPQLDLSQQHLPTGTYLVSFKAFDLNGTLATSGSTTVTLVEVDFSAVNVYPNPFRAARGDSAIVFDQLPLGSTVKIFTVSGHWVTTLTATGLSVSWDLTNADGKNVASGLYLYLIKDARGNQLRGKLAIIR